jgi:coenzyme PQQ biosynthesis protein PqqD
MSAAQPRLARKAQLRFDRLSGRYLLLYPERGLRLSDVAAAVVQRCDGAHSPSQIVDALAAQNAPPREIVADAVRRLLDALAARGLVE